MPAAGALPGCERPQCIDVACKETYFSDYEWVSLFPQTRWGKALEACGPREPGSVSETAICHGPASWERLQTPQQQKFVHKLSQMLVQLRAG